MSNAIRKVDKELEMKEKTSSTDRRPWWQAWGPSAIVAAAIVGPGTITTVSVTGATYGYQGAWIIVLACFIAYFVQKPVIKWTIQTSTGAMEGVRNEIGKGWAIFLYIALLIGALAFQAGNFLGAAMALNFFAPNVSFVTWVALLSFGALAISLIGVYKLIENINRTIIVLMAAAFLITVIASGPSASEIATTGFSFQIPGGDYWLVLALIATTLPPNTVLALSAFTKRKYSQDHSISQEEKIRRGHADLRVNFIITAFITLSILICAGATLYGTGATVTSAGDMAGQLTPVLGQYAGILFALGLWAAGFSSGLFNLSVQPMLFGQAFGTSEDAKAHMNRGIMIATAILPVLIVFLFGQMPIELIISAQALNGLLLPIIVGFIWILSNKKGKLGFYKNTLVQNIRYGIILAIVSVLAVRVLLQLIGAI
ncbi:Nramp family divalent metal transporter [Halalkalibacter okhensis]|uniref:Manganese transporter n=1 Tax=Halalkalibacter okhensis TaxID=333138 RepID=A0A0B0IA61_9BACI|nr:Nramp family divalent metal transporter [Halalkalibacter okhensis]KHF39408.1 hypothetical protein LQ50_15210 [Halalkalibacter okhensis]